MSTTPDNNKDFEDIDALAGEYVLGTLSAAARSSVDERIRNEPALRDAVHAWQARLLPLAALAPPAEPSPALWARIERSLGPTGARRCPRRRRLQEARRPSRIGGTT
jgi:anti-sigma-K factor RskA